MPVSLIDLVDYFPFHRPFFFFFFSLGTSFQFICAWAFPSPDASQHLTGAHRGSPGPAGLLLWALHPTWLRRDTCCAGGKPPLPALPALLPASRPLFAGGTFFGRWGERKTRGSSHPIITLDKACCVNVCALLRSQQGMAVTLRVPVRARSPSHHSAPDVSACALSLRSLLPV